MSIYHGHSKKPSRKKKKKVDLEKEFLDELLVQFPNIPDPERQYKFHPTRGWLADFAWPDLKIIVEIQGGSFMRVNKYRKGRKGLGGHNNALGQAKDYEKWREAARLGWKLFPFNTHDLRRKKSKLKKYRKGWTIYDCAEYIGCVIEAEMEKE